VALFKADKMKKSVFIFFAFFFTVFILNSQIIPDNQRIDWKPGIPGGIHRVEAPVKNIADFGADPKGVSDSYPAIKAAMDALPASGGVVFIPEGTYKIGSTITIEKDNIIIRGSGTSSRLKMGNKGNSIEVKGDERDNWQKIKSGFSKDSRAVIVEGGSVFKPGQFVEIEQDNNPAAMYTKPEWNQDWGENAVGQLLRVEEVSGNELKLKSPLHFSYSPEFNPRIRPIKLISGVGFENFYIEKTVASGHTFLFQSTALCWILQVESNHTRKSHVSLTRCLACTIRDCYFHHSFDYGGGGSGYGVECGEHTTDVLVENNVFDSLRHSMLVQVGANGNVYGYNFSRHTVQGDGETNLNQGWIPPDISIHGHYPYMNLFEGNDVEEIGIADYWGPAGPGNTYFRNKVNGEGIFLYDISLGQNIAGNQTTAFTDEKNVASQSTIYGNVVGNTIAPMPKDAKPLPVSLYLDSIPPFLSGKTLPFFGPDVAAKNKLPAQERFEGGHPTVLPGVPEK
jgi:hypothetical protein